MSWPPARLKHLCVDSGQYGLNVSSSEYSTTGTRLVRTSDISDSGTLREPEHGVFIDFEPDRRFLLMHGDLLLSRSGTLGRSLLIPPLDGGSLAFAGYLIRFRPRPDVDARFIKYVSMSSPFQSAIKADAVESTIQNFNAGRYAGIEVPCPLLEEQRRIADFLDAETARIDQLGQMLRDALALLAERDSTNANTAFDGPGHKVQLRRLVSRWVDYRGATPAKTEHGVPLITAKNISDGRVEHDRSPEFISTDDYKEWMRRGLPQPGDVLLTTEAPLGEVALLEDTAVALAQRVILMRTHKRPDSEWIYWYFRSPIDVRQVRRRSGSRPIDLGLCRYRRSPQLNNSTASIASSGLSRRVIGFVYPFSVNSICWRSGGRL